MITISIIVPVYAGQNYLERLVHEVNTIREQARISESVFEFSELIFVIDDAQDGSANILETLAKKYSWIKVFHLSRNFGQHAATIAGISNSLGMWVVTLDEDLQHHPKHINSLFVKVANTGCDLVYANPSGEVHGTVMRDMSSKLFKRAMEFATNNRKLRFINSFRLIRGDIARGAATACPHDIYFDISLSWFTTRIEAVSLELKDERYASSKSSGYSFRSLMSHARRMLASSQLKFLRLGFYFGLLSLALSLIVSAGLVCKKVLFPHSFIVEGWVSQFVISLIFGGMTMLLLGVILEYVAILIIRSHGRPLYFIVSREGDHIIREWFSQNSDIN